jgi:hypothetical protein
MRTTVDLPEDLHRVVASLALHSRRTFSQAATELIRRGLSAPLSTHDSAGPWTVNPVSGLPLLASARVITPEDVKAVDDSD